MTQTDKAHASRAGATGAGRVGRWAGVACFWVLAIYFLGICFYSVGSALFGTPPAAGDRLADGDCARELSTLTEQLYASAASTLRDSAGTDGLNWTHRWDRQLAALQGRCGPLSRQQTQLRSLRLSIGQMLRRHQRDDAAQRRSLEQALKAYDSSS